MSLFVEYVDMQRYIKLSHRFIYALYKDYDFGLKSKDGANLDAKPNLHQGNIVDTFILSMISAYICFEHLLIAVC
jgi:hypothetical protein